MCVNPFMHFACEGSSQFQSHPGDLKGGGSSHAKTANTWNKCIHTQKSLLFSGLLQKVLDISAHENSKTSISKHTDAVSVNRASNKTATEIITYALALQRLVCVCVWGGDPWLCSLNLCANSWRPIWIISPMLDRGWPPPHTTSPCCKLDSR